MALKQSNLDRAIRIVFGLLLLSMMFWGPRTLIGIIGLIPLVTGIVGVRALYTLFWIDPGDAPGGPSKKGSSGSAEPLARRATHTDGDIP